MRLVSDGRLGMVSPRWNSQLQQSCTLLLMNNNTKSIPAIEKKDMITKNKITARAIIYQLIGYGILLFLIAETFIEGTYIVLLCAFTIYLSLRFLKRFKFLEGFLPICSYCKKIRIKTIRLMRV